MRKKDGTLIRPSYPSAGRQWFGLVLTIGFVFGFDYARTLGLPPAWGNLYLLLIPFVTYWSGMRMGYIATAVVLGYSAIATQIPSSALYGRENMGERLLYAGIFFGILVTVTGIVQGKLRVAALRTFDARVATERAVKELQKSERLRSTVVDSATDAIIAFDVNGLVVFWNPSAERIFGWSNDEIIGRRLSKAILPEHHREEHELALRRYRENGDGMEFGERQETTGIDKHGREFDIELSVVPCKIDDDTLFVAFARDISAQRRLQRDLLTAQRLDSIGQFAGGVAHDFNNVLSVIVGYAEIAKLKLPEDSEAQEALDEILMSARRSSEIQSQLLAFARKQATAPKIVSLNEIINGIRLMFRTLIKENIDIWFTLDEGLWPVTVDPGKFEQLLTNLVLNARDAMPKGGKLMIETRNVTIEPDAELPIPDLKPGEYATVSVSDTGEGIPPEIIDRIFEPFFTTKDDKGTGMGLASSYGIAAQANGLITVYSEVGHGSMFRVYLPRAVGKVEQLNGKVERPTAQKGTETVLVAEDNEQVRTVLVHTLEHYGYKVLDADSGDTALDLARKHDGKIDLLLTDLIMPRVGGTELAQKLREARPGVPVIFISGYTEEAITAQGVEGIDGVFMQKPVMPTDLAAKVREVLDSQVPASARSIR